MESRLEGENGLLKPLPEAPGGQGGEEFFGGGVEPDWK